MKQEHKEEKVLIYDRIAEISGKVEQNQRFVYGAGAVLATVVVVAQLLPVFGWTLTPVNQNAMLGETPSVHVVS